MIDHITHSPQTITSALDMLKKGDTTIIAGGTDVMVMNASSLNGIFKKNILNLLDIKELDYIKEESEYISIGAGVTHTEIASSEIIKKYAPNLAHGASLVGGPQIRNRGTIGGNICNASPAGDLLPSLYVLNARLTLKSSETERTVPIVDFAKAPRRTVLAENELLTEITIDKAAPSDICGFERVAPRKALAITKASVAVFARMQDVISDIKIAMGSVAPTVIRATLTEKLLNGKKLTPELISAAVEKIREDSKPIADIRSTAEYRSYITGVLLKKILEGYLS